MFIAFVPLDPLTIGAERLIALTAHSENMFKKCYRSLVCFSFFTPITVDMVDLKHAFVLKPTPHAPVTQEIENFSLQRLPFFHSPLADSLTIQNSIRLMVRSDFFLILLHPTPLLGVFARDGPRFGWIRIAPFLRTLPFAFRIHRIPIPLVC